jgi:hypothetical protein
MRSAGKPLLELCGQLGTAYGRAGSFRLQPLYPLDTNSHSIHSDVLAGGRTEVVQTVAGHLAVRVTCGSKRIIKQVEGLWTTDSLQAATNQVSLREHKADRPGSVVTQESPCCDGVTQRQGEGMGPTLDGLRAQ